MNSLQPDKLHKPVNEYSKHYHACKPPKGAEQTGNGNTEQKNHVFVIANNSTFVKGGKNKMKKVFILAAIMILWAGMVFGAGTSVITSITPYANGWTKVLVTFTADAGDNTVPDLNIVGFGGQWLCQIVTNPGTTGPTDNYDIYLKYDGADLLGGAGTDRDISNTEIAYPIVDSVSGQRGCVPVPGTLVFSLANNAAASATGTMEVHFKRTPY